MSEIGAAAISPTKVGRNDLCPCGSGKKFKHCCQGKDARGELPPGAVHGSTPTVELRPRLRALVLAAKNHAAAERWSDAVRPLLEVVRLEPKSASAHYDLGVAYLNCGQLDAAAQSLRRALELRPGFTEALGQLALALEQAAREPEALLAYRKLSRATDDPLERLHYSAKSLIMEGKLEDAEKCLRRLLVLAPRHMGTWVLLGEVLATRGMFDEAARCLTPTIDVFPGAFERLTEVKRMTEADRPLIDRMQGVVERPGLNGPSRIAVHFGLGKAFDDLGDYAEAMRHYERANGLRAMTARLDRAALKTQFDSIVARFTVETLARLAHRLARPACPGDDMPLFVVGMPRSGTTLVEQILSSHPVVAAAGELDFWKSRSESWRSAAPESLEANTLAKAAEDYRALLRGMGPHALRVTDKAPRNFQLLWALRLAFPDARIIHCRRRAVDTCLSIFFTDFSRRHEYAWDRGDLVFFYRQYERLMDHWRRVLPADRFAEVDYETLISDRETETRRLVAFCGLEWDDACLAPERNQRAVKTASIWQARQPVYKTSVERWRRYEPWLGELRELLPDGAQRS